jgi:hypothetical protein
MVFSFSIKTKSDKYLISLSNHEKYPQVSKNSEKS